jgi:hypothetical protein
LIGGIVKVSAAIKVLNTAAKKFGGHVENDSVGNYITLQVCSPAGKVWSASGSVHLVVTTYRGPQEWLDDAVEDALERIAYGVEESEEVEE